MADRIAGGDEPFPIAWRIAGALLLGFAALSVPHVLTLARVAPWAVRGFGAAWIVDVVAGGALVLGRGQLRPLAIVRVAVGAVVFTAYLWLRLGALAGALQAVASLCLLGLLWGRPGALRTALAAVAPALILALGAAGTVAPGLFYREPDGPTVNAIIGVKAATPELARATQRPRCDWRLELPRGRCRARPAEPGRGDPGVDMLANRTVVCSGDDARIAVTVEELRSAGTGDVAGPSEVAVERLRESISDLEVVSREAHPANPGAVLLQARGSSRWTRYRFVIGVYRDGPFVVQVTAMAPEQQFERTKDELVRSVSSLTLR